MRRQGRNGSKVADPRPHAGQLYNHSEVKMSLRTARTDLNSLARVTKVIDLVPENLQTEAFDILIHHLRKPLDSVKHPPGQRENRFSPKWILVCLMGIKGLGLPYFDLDEIHRQKFVECWPHIMRWLREFLVGGYIRGEEKVFYRQVPSIFETARVTCGESLDNNEAIDLAVQMWNGHYSAEGTNYFAAQPLHLCLHRSIDTGSDPSYLLESMFDHGNEQQELVDKFLVRLVDAGALSTPMDIQTMFTLIIFMGQLGCLENETMRTAIFSPRIGRALMVHARRIMDEPGASMSKLHVRSADSSFNIIMGCISNGHAKQMIKGLLPVLLKLAHLDSVEPTTTAVEVLDLLHKALFFSDLVTVCRTEFCMLYTGDMRIEGLLKSTPKDFQVLWDAFGSLLLQQLLLKHLFQIGYAPEGTACSNHLCQRAGSRGKFKKCEGCNFALYCSRSCQRVDWLHHRDECKQIDEGSLRALANANNKFVRRAMAIHISRYYDGILALSRIKNISKGNIGVHVLHKNGLVQIDVLDTHELLHGTDNSPILVMAARDFARGQGRGLNECLVFYSMANTLVPCIVQLDDRWTKDIGSHTGELDEENPIYFDGMGNPLVPKKTDAIRVGAHLCRKYALETGQPVWSESVLQRATSAVIAHFRDEIEEMGEC